MRHGSLRVAESHTHLPSESCSAADTPQQCLLRLESRQPTRRLDRIDGRCLVMRASSSIRSPQGLHAPRWGALQNTSTHTLTHAHTLMKKKKKMKKKWNAAKPEKKVHKLVTSHVCYARPTHASFQHTSTLSIFFFLFLSSSSSGGPPVLASNPSAANSSVELARALMGGFRNTPVPLPLPLPSLCR